MPPPKKGAQLPLSQFLAHVCCGQTAGWIKMPLGMEIGFGPGHIMLDGDSHPPPKKGHSPPLFGPCLLWPNGWMDQDATWYEGRPRPRPHCVVWGSSFPPIFSPCLLSRVAKRSPISATAKHLLYSGRNAHILSEVEVDHVYSSQSVDWQWLNGSRLSQSMVCHVSQSYAQRLTPGTIGQPS